MTNTKVKAKAEPTVPKVKAKTESAVTKVKPKTEPTFWTRNYLILIITMVVLICATIGVALAFATLDAFQKWFLILTLFIFPFFSISIVTWLILRHSSKLTVGEQDEILNWETTSSEKQKRKLNNEVRELAKQLDLSTEQLSDLRSAYIVAEDLALRKIQGEAHSPLMRKISIGNSDFDAIFLENDLITCIEVTFVVTDDVAQDKINSYLRKTAAAKTILAKMREGSRVRLLLVLVTQLDESTMATLNSNVRGKFKETPVSVDVRFLDFLTLQKIYAED